MVSVEAVMEYSQIGGYGSYGGGDGGEIDGDYGGCGGGGDGGGIDSGYGGGGYGGGSSGGSGSSSGDGSGGGYGGVDIKTINGLHTVIIDSTLTALTNIRGNVAKGFIVNVNLTLEPCYVVKHDNLFSHGKSVKSAMSGLRNKLFEEMSEEERIDMFWEEHNIESEYQALDLYEWHNKLTGSCELGRRSFCKNHNIDLNKDKFTVKQFVELCRNDYGGDVIRKLLKED